MNSLGFYFRLMPVDGMVNPNGKKQDGYGI